MSPSAWLANVLQFLDFSREILTKGKELYRSIDGNLAENSDTEKITQDFKLLSDKIKTSSEIVDPVLEELCRACSSICEQLLAALAKLHAKGKLSRLQSFGAALRTLWGKEKIRNFDARLSRYRAELLLHITVING